MKPIKRLVYKPACESWNELLNFATNIRTSSRSSEYYCEKLSEIDCKTSLQNDKLQQPDFNRLVEIDEIDKFFATCWQVATSR